MSLATREILKEKVLTIVEEMIKGKGARKKKILLGAKNLNFFFFFCFTFIFFNFLLLFFFSL
jgi:hypothetical protein